MTYHEGNDSRHRNVLLAGLLEELGWSHGRVTSEINAILGRGYIGRSTVSEWVNQSRLPREPVPGVIAHVLSNALGRAVSPQELWPEWVRRTPQWVPADTDTDVAWTAEGARALVQDWLANGGKVTDRDRRDFTRHTGRAALLLALDQHRFANKLSDEADELLTPEVADHPNLRPRYACLYGAWLARLYVRRGDIEHATDTAATALRRLQPVRSPMTITVLRDLDKDLASCKGAQTMPQVRQLRRELRPVISA